MKFTAVCLQLKLVNCSVKDCIGYKSIANMKFASSKIRVGRALNNIVKGLRVGFCSFYK